MIHRFGEMLWPHGAPAIRLQVIVSFVLIAVGKLVLLAAPFIYKRLVDALSAPHIVVVPILLVIAYGSARLITQMMNGLRQLAFIRVGQRAIRLTAIDLFRHLHSLSLRFHLDRKSGGVAQIVGRGTISIEFLAELVLFTLVPTVIELVAVVVILAGAYRIEYAVTTLVTLAAYLAVTTTGAGRQVAMRRKTNALDVASSISAMDSLLNFETVKYFAAEQFEVDRYDRTRRAYESSAILAKLTETFVALAQATTLAVGAIVLMAMAAHGVAAGEMSVGDFVLINAFLLQLYTPLEALAIVYGGVRQAYTDTELMFDLLSIEPEVRDAPDAAPLALVGGRIVFDEVSFSYDRRRLVLHDVSFEIPPGHRVAIVGPSGGGKSTIARLLFRFFDVDSGRITIDGQDIRAVTQDSLRRAIGVVPQDTVLFNEEAGYNIAYGAPDAADADVVAAARAAHLHAAIAQLPDGYRSTVGERGLKLSGGEKQRVAIARVMLKAPPILIFDEATSALDTRTERDIQASLNLLSTSRSTLVVAHRLSTIADADQILVLVGGRIVERGRHNDLIADGGYYATMWRKQQGEETGKN